MMAQSDGGRDTPAADPIVVVGLSCRFPGVDGPAHFAELLRTARKGESADTGSMEPPRQLMSELAREAFADAGISDERFRGSRTGVFIGTSGGGVPNGVSHTLGLHGPSVTVDSGQSAALVAVHLAVESMRRGECACALAGGVAEGAGGGLVLLKFRSAALVDRDPVYCVLAGSAVNNDGSGQNSQESLLRKAYQLAGVAPEDVGYVEPHDGTGAAGIAGLIKVALGVSNREWAEQGETPVAGVSAFGSGGTNCHVVLTADQAEVTDEITHRRAAVSAVGSAFAAFLSGASPEVMATQAHALFERLDDDGRTVFVFPGEAARWTGMAVQLMESSPVFANRMLECATALEWYTDWNLIEALHGPMDRVDIAQPALFAVLVSLAELWSAAGVQPDAVTGHGSGEIAAAVVAGALSLEDGARVAAIRAQAMVMLANVAGRLLLPVDAERAREMLLPWDGRISIAELNGPRSTVVSGDPAALDALVAHSAERDIHAQWIAIDATSRSVDADEVRECMLEMLASLAPSCVSTTFVSSVTGQALDGIELDASYWYRNLVSTVRFEQATRCLLASGYAVFVEVSPQPVLTPALKDIVEASPIAGVRSLLARRLSGLSGVAQQRELLGLVHATPKALADHLTTALNDAGPVGIQEGESVPAHEDRVAIVAVARRELDSSGFDAALFGVAPEDAAAMDAGQSALLEAIWEVSERARINPKSLCARHTGVFIGGMSPLSGQVARTFGLSGPAMTLDTGDSSALASVHVAARALRNDECDLAVAGGVAESAEVLLLERLSDARDHGHRVLAVLRGSAMSAGDSTQRRAVNEALRDAGLDRSDVDTVDVCGSAVTEALRPLLGESVERPRYVGISSFDTNGTDVHLILEKAVDVAPTRGEVRELADTPLLLSAANSAALREQARRLVAHLEANPGLHLTDVAYSLATTRAALPSRIAVVGDRAESLAGLAAIAAGEITPAADRAGKLTFFFTGEIAQGFGRDLHAEFPVFAEAFDEVCAEMDSLLDYPLKDIVFAADPQDGFDGTVYWQAGIFAVEVALYRLAQHWGLAPARLAGRAVGEVSAAHCAGVLSLADACALVAARGRLLRAFPRGGAMISVAAAERDVRDQLPEDVSVIDVRGPDSVIVSGSEAAIARVADWFTERDVPTRRLCVDRITHADLLAPILIQFTQVLDLLEFAEPVIPLVAGGEVRSSRYWLRHAREATRFADNSHTLRMVGAATDLGSDVLLTAEPQRSLGLSSETSCVALLHREQVEARSVLTAFTQLHGRGVELDWAEFFAGTGAREVELPTYPFAQAEGASPVVTTRPTGEFWRYKPELDFGTVLPALSSWWDNHNKQSTVDTPCGVKGTWLVVTPAEGACAPLAGAVCEALVRDGVVVRSVEAGACDREQLAEQLRAALDGEAPDGVLALAGVRTDVLELAMSDAEIDARLWCLKPARTQVEPVELAQVRRQRSTGVRRGGPRAMICQRRRGSGT